MKAYNSIVQQSEMDVFTLTVFPGCQGEALYLVIYRGQSTAEAVWICESEARLNGEAWRKFKAEQLPLNFYTEVRSRSL